MTDKRIALGSAVKALGENVVGGYLIRFTDNSRRDLYGEYFDAATEYRLQDFEIVGSPTLFHHGLDETIKAHAIGKVIKAEMTDKGLWIEARLKERDEYTSWVKELLDSGELGWSSGALPQAVRVSDAGHIEEWPVIEASITHTPAMPHDTAITSIKSLQPIALKERHPDAKEVHITAKGAVSNVTVNFSDDIASPTRKSDNTQEETMNKDIIEKSSALKALDEDTRAEIQGMIEVALADFAGLIKDEMKMDGEELDPDAARAGEEAAVEAVAEEAAKMEHMDEEEVAKTFIRAYMEGYHAARQARIEARRNAVQNAMHDLRNEAGVSKKSTAGGKTGSMNISVGEERKYEHLTAAQMALAAEMVVAPARAAGVPDRIAIQSLSDSFLRTMVNKASKYAQGDPYKNRDSNAALKSAIPFRADEINASNIAGQGTEWLANFYSTEIWEKARYETHYGKLVQKGMWEKEIPDGHTTAYFPTEAADPIAYATSEANDLASGRVEVTANVGFIGTGQVSVTPRELKLATAVTTILKEDSIINIIQQTERQLQTAALEYVDRLMLNGDTATGGSTNINLIDGTPASGVTTTPYYIASNGFRKYPLVTATSYSRDAGATFDLADYRLTFGLLDAETRARKQNIAFIVDPATHLSSLAISEIATEDVRRTFAATITSGSVLSLYGIDVLESGFLPESNATGKVSGTPSNNIYGSILAVYAPYWGAAWRRRITLETGRDIYSGANIYVLSMRLGFVARGSSAASISYNVNNN